jgi:hypothetical protein
MRLLGLLLALAALAPAQALAAGEAFTVAGNATGADPVDGRPATSAGINVYPPLAPLPDGTFLVGAYWRVWHVDAQGRLRLVAGTGESASTGDGGPALRASMDVDALAALPGGGYLIGDILHERIRMVDAAGTITTVGGGGTLRGDGVRATQADLDPADVAALPGGGFVVSDYRHRVRAVGPDGIVRTIAGSGKLPQDTRPVRGRATAAAIDPGDLAVAADGSVLIANEAGAQVDRVAPDGTISTLTSGVHPAIVPAGEGEAGFSPQGLAALPDGGFLVSDDPPGVPPGRLWRGAPDGTLAPLAGDGAPIVTAPLGLQQRLTGQDAHRAVLDIPADVATLPDGGILLADGSGDEADGGGFVRYIAPAAPQMLAVAILRDRDRVFRSGRPAVASVALTRPAAVAVTVAGRTAVADLPAGVSRLALPGPPRGRHPLTVKVAATGADGRRAYDRSRIYPSTPFLPEETARAVIAGVRFSASADCRRFSDTRVDCATEDDLDRCWTVSARLVHRRLRWAEYGCGFRRHPRHYTVAPHAARPREWLCDMINATCPPKLFGRVDSAALAPAD